MPEAPLLIVDFSCFVHICWWPAVSANEADEKYDPRQVVLKNVEGKLLRVQRGLDKLGIRSHETVFVEDRNPVRKMTLFPAYRADRKHEMPEDIKPLVKTWLRLNGYLKWCWSDDNEADDTIATVVKQASDRRSVILTSDKDLWQLISDSVHVYQPVKDRPTTMDDVHDKFYGADPGSIPLIKALWGDASDNIPNAVPRMQKQLMPVVIKSDKTPEGFISECESADLSERCKALLRAGVPQVLINWKLVKLDVACPLTWQTDPIRLDEI